MSFPNALKSAARSLWFTSGSARRCFWGPYSGLIFQVSPALEKSRMSVFYQAYEPEVTHWLESVIRPGSVFYDVGAHIGIHSLYAAKLLRGKGHIHAFEPWPDNFEHLSKHIELNHLSNIVTAEQMALSDHAAVAAMVVGGTDGTHHLARGSTPPDQEVQTMTLDLYTQTAPPPDAMKIDVEGFEYEVLNGGREILTQRRPKLIVEHHGDALRDRTSELLRSFGYRTHAVGRRQIAAS
jgi:FkbM family methyltransferase